MDEESKRQSERLDLSAAVFDGVYGDYDAVLFSGLRVFLSVL